MVKQMLKLKKLKQINELDSLYLQVENLQNKNLELTDELKEVRKELKELKSDFSQLNALFFNATESLSKQISEVPVIVIGETSIGENILSYHLRTSPQTQSKNHRYYYKSNYLFTAPLNLKNILTIEFNRLMNSNLSFESVVEELKVYKDSLETELKANGIQTELEGSVFNGS